MPQTFLLSKLYGRLSKTRKRDQWRKKCEVKRCNVSPCRSKSVDISWYRSMLVNVGQCWLMPVDTSWCPLLSVDVCWCLLMSVDVRWCPPMSVNVCPCPSMSVDVCRCPSMSVDVRRCLSLSVDVCWWPSMPVDVSRYWWISVNYMEGSVKPGNEISEGKNVKWKDAKLAMDSWPYITPEDSMLQARLSLAQHWAAETQLMKNWAVLAAKFMTPRVTYQRLIYYHLRVYIAQASIAIIIDAQFLAQWYKQFENYEKVSDFKTQNSEFQLWAILSNFERF